MRLLPIQSENYAFFLLISVVAGNVLFASIQLQTYAHRYAIYLIFIYLTMH